MATFNQSRKFSPFDIGKRFRILPPANCPSPLHDTSIGARIEIILARGAFGSGEHETTASCLEILEAIPRIKDARVLDMGCGTGILAIAALNLGARSAVCVDIDPDALLTCRLNSELNRLGDRMTLVRGATDTIRPDRFDLILANIYGDILLRIADRLISTAFLGARLLLSGIMHQDDYEVRQRFVKGGCKILERRQLEEFCTLLLERTRPEESLPPPL